jgi:hypothetical protein
MVRFSFIFLFILAIRCFSQDDGAFRYKSVLKGDATIAPGYMLKSSQTNIYINGSLEYFPEDKISLRGESYWMAGAQQKPALLKDNSSFLFGGLYHFHKNRLDYFVGVETGVNITKPNDVKDSFMVGSSPVIFSVTRSFGYKALPVLSPVTGITFYVSNYFNFFLNVRYVSSRYFGYVNGSTLSLDELRISAGLGFLIHLKKS